MINLVSLTKKHEEFLTLRNKTKGLSVDLKIIKNIKALKKTKKLKSFEFSTLHRIIGANQLFDDIVSYEQFITDEHNTSVAKLATMKKELFMEWIEVYKPTFMSIPFLFSEITSYQKPFNSELVYFGINKKLNIFDDETFNNLIRIRLKPGNPIKIHKEAVYNLPYTAEDVPLNDIETKYQDYLVLRVTDNYKYDDFQCAEIFGYNPKTDEFFNGIVEYLTEEQT